MNAFISIPPLPDRRKPSNAAPPGAPPPSIGRAPVYWAGNPIFSTASKLASSPSALISISRLPTPKKKGAAIATPLVVPENQNAA
ncbi:hypothetical protein OF829_04185 [Sphingomonas sp. LB-2]|uniref:hypothetical protein n=1 Tax=Sphingomonas caeni TaxID=2984949 RepID=UPI00222E37A2|nr:hypothetical protein [Sphingomonas caeni]MCW3846426.1 hypothetical protein [Sphingomonas caeni]